MIDSSKLVEVDKIKDHKLEKKDKIKVFNKSPILKVVLLSVKKLYLSILSSSYALKMLLKVLVHQLNIKSFITQLILTLNNFML